MKDRLELESLSKELEWEFDSNSGRGYAEHLGGARFSFDLSGYYPKDRVNQFHHIKAVLEQSLDWGYYVGVIRARAKMKEGLGL